MRLYSIVGCLDHSPTGPHESDSWGRMESATSRISRVLSSPYRSSCCCAINTPLLPVGLQVAIVISQNVAPVISWLRLVLLIPLMLGRNVLAVLSSIAV